MTIHVQTTHLKLFVLKKQQLGEVAKPNVVHFQQLRNKRIGPFSCSITIDALPTPWRTQMWVQVKDIGRRRSRDALPSSQHFEGVEGRVGAPGWD